MVEDSEVISKIYATSWKTAYRNIVPQQYLDELKDDNWVVSFQNWIKNNMLTAKILYDDNPIGCIAYGKSRDIKFDNWAEIVSIYILPNYLKKGYGQKLFRCALDDLKSQEYKNCFLWVLDKNDNAITFYKKNGFYYNGDKYKFKIMDKELIDLRFISKL